MGTTVDAAAAAPPLSAADLPLPPPLDDSRRLTGHNVYFEGPGAALETVGPIPDDDALLRWQSRIFAAREALGWPLAPVLARRHKTGVSLASGAPLDQLYTATEVNEWAWMASVQPTGDGAHAPAHAAAWDAASAFGTLRAVARAEANPALLALGAEAHRRQLPFLPDDDEVTVGAGTGNRTWFADDLPDAASVPWDTVHAIPMAVVTGSNGKTTSVRLLAAMMASHGWKTAFSCTDGVFFDGVALDTGDFSGPTGARTALRQSGAEAAVLETARGGLLRRGLAVQRADVALVTNISPDHFGEYGIHGLDDLAAVKLTVARAIDRDGVLVLNADDPRLLKAGDTLRCPIAWFALDAAHPRLVAYRAAHGTTCGVADGRLCLHAAGVAHDLGAVAAMPLTLSGRAKYNIANAAGAALAAHGLGVPPATIAGVLATFGRAHADNPGRLQHWNLGGVEVFLDYAHNTDGLAGLMETVGAAQRTGRLALLLGHAGNREDSDLRAVATVGASFGPDLVVLKDIDGYQRGREAGEVAAIMRQALVDAGVRDGAIRLCLDEVQAALMPLGWAAAGDLVVLPVHELEARAQVVAVLDGLQAAGWRPGDVVPGSA